MKDNIQSIKDTFKSKDIYKISSLLTFILFAWFVFDS